MFLSKGKFRKLLKEAHKEGLTLQRSYDGWLYLAGRHWEAMIEESCIPNQTKGDIVSLTGELPAKGERFTDINGEI